MLYPEEVSTFLAIARLGSLGQAADAVHASQSTVSYRLQSLERRLGYSLVERSRGAQRTALTVPGQAFFSLAERWESLVREAQQLHDDRHIAIAVGAADAIDTYIMPAVYEHLGNMDPTPSLRIEIASGHVLCDHVAKRHLDVAYVFFARQHTDLHVHPLFSSPMVVIRAAGSVPLSPDEPVNLDALPSHREVYMPWGPDFDLWRRRLLPDDIFVRSAKAHSVLPFLSIPETWAVVPMFMVPELTERASCTVHQIADPPPDRVVFRVTNRKFAGAVAAHVALFDRFLQDSMDERVARLSARRRSRGHGIRRRSDGQRSRTPSDVNGD